MGRRVVLPEFAQGGALPAAAGFGAAFGRGIGLGKVLPDVSGDGGAGALEVKPAGQFIGHEGEVEGLAVREEVGQEGVGDGGPVGMMIATGGLEGEVLLMSEPLMAQFVEARAADHQPLGGSRGIQLAGVESGQDFLDVESSDPVSELLLFIGDEK